MAKSKGMAGMINTAVTVKAPEAVMLQAVQEALTPKLPRRNLSITLDATICDKLEEESKRLRKTGIKHTWTLSMIIEGLLRKHLEQ